MGDKTFNDFRNVLTEASLTRIWDAIQKHSSGAITSYRGERTKAENKANQRELLAYLKTKGYSVISVKGSYIENFGSDNQKEVGEPSFIVINREVEGDDGGKLKADLIKLGKKYDQDSVLIIPVGGKDAYLHGTSKRDNAYPDYGKEVKVGSGKFGYASGEFFSRVRGRKFAFEEIDFPQTINGIRGWKILSDLVEQELKEFE